MQERFQSVLKRRLQIHIESHPPLFPWESQVADYPDYVEESSLVFAPNWGWLAQQAKLNLPVNLPERVFQELLEKCQQMVTSSLPLGAKLVQVVEGFFPNESQILNDLAGLVLRASYRSPQVEIIPDMQRDYADLDSHQQMALSLLAAKQLLAHLTLPVSLTSPVVERLWLTSLGALTLRLEYRVQGDMAQLVVQSDLPTQGTLTLQGNEAIAIAQSSSPGSLSVELTCKQLQPTYTLEVDCPELDQQPLVFVISPTI